MRGHRVLRVHGKGDRVAHAPLPPAVGRAIDHAANGRDCRPVWLNRDDKRMDRHCATRRLRVLANTAGITTTRMHPHNAPPHVRHHHARRRRRPPRRSDRCTPRRPAHHDALRPSSRQPRPPPQLHPGGLHGISDVTRHHAEERTPNSRQIMTVRQPDLLVSPRKSVDVASDLLVGALAVQHHVVKQPWLRQLTHRFPDPARASGVRPACTRRASFATSVR